MASSLIRVAKEVIRTERDALSGLLPKINREFERACELSLKCKGRLVLTGMGKPGLIARKISATLASTGTPSLFLHPAEAFHGDLGRVQREDVVIAISNSGQTDEVVQLLPLVKKIGAKLIAMTGNKQSVLAKFSDVVLDTGVKKEANPLVLAPTASTTAMLAMGDALALAVAKKRKFHEKDFAFFHPGGNIGKKLLSVKEIMRTGKSYAVVPETMKVKDVLLRITKARAGSATVVNKKGKLTGIFTDGDLRRHLDDPKSVLSSPVRDHMTRRPAVIEQHHLAEEAFNLLRSKKVDEVPVVDRHGRPTGLLDVQDLLKAGLV